MAVAVLIAVGVLVWVGSTLLLDAWRRRRVDLGSG
jgi:hypothetical protein